MPQPVGKTFSSTAWSLIHHQRVCLGAGWNDFCAPKEIQHNVYDEYASNFAHLVQNLRAEFKTHKLPVVIAEVGVGGEKTDIEMLYFRMAQSKIKARPELSGTLGYVRTTPY
jgi:hypothetical protein